MNTPKIYVADLKSYNEGRLIGEWIDLTEYDNGEEVKEKIDELMTKYSEKYHDGDETEFAIHDFEHFDSSLYSESMGEKEFDIIIATNKISEEKDLSPETLQIIMSENSLESDELEDWIEERYVGKFENDYDIGYEYAETVGGIEGISNPEMYFDYEGLGRDLSINDYNQIGDDNDYFRNYKKGGKILNYDLSKYKKGGEITIHNLQTPEKAVKMLEETGLYQDFMSADSESLRYSIFENAEEIYKKGVFEKGGETISRESVVEILKDELEDVLEDANQEYEGQEITGEEVEHESRDGFISYADGGYEYRFFVYGNYLTGSGKSLPTNTLDGELERREELNYEYGKERFEEEYPEIVKELGKDNIDYSSLQDAGYMDEAEELDEFSRSDDDSIMFEVEAFYYNPDNDKGFDGKHTIVLSGSVNMEAPYHRTGNYEDYTQDKFTFDSIEDLKEKLQKGIDKISKWFDGENYKEGRELKMGRFAKGGMIDKDIAKFKKQLIAKEKSRGLYENFGQKEVSKLYDKYDRYGEDGDKIQEFSDWASGYDGTRYAKGGVTVGFYDEGQKSMRFQQFDNREETKKFLEKEGMKEVKKDPKTRKEFKFYAKGGEVKYSNQTSDDFKLGELVYDTTNKRYGTIIGIYDETKYEVRLDSDGMQPTEYLRKLGDKEDKGTKKQLFEAVSSIERLQRDYPENNYPKLINNPFYAKGGSTYQGGGEIKWWTVELKMPNGEIVYEDVIAEDEDDAEYYGELTDSADEGGKVLSVKFKGTETYAKGGKTENQAIYEWNTMDRFIRADFLEEIEEDVNLGDDRFYMKGYKYDDLPKKVQKEVLNRLSYAKGGMTKGGSMASGGEVEDKLELFYVMDNNGNVKNISKSYEKANDFLEKSLKLNGKIGYKNVLKSDWDAENINASNIKKYAKGGMVDYSKDGYVKAIRNIDGKMIKEVVVNGVKYRRNSIYKTYNSIKDNELLHKNKYSKGGKIRVIIADNLDDHTGYKEGTILEVKEIDDDDYMITKEGYYLSEGEVDFADQESQDNYYKEMNSRYAKGGEVKYSNQTSDDFKLGELVYDTTNKRYGTIIGIYDETKYEVRLDSDGMQPTEYLRKLGDKEDKGTKKQLFEAVASTDRLRSSYPENNYPKIINNPFYAKGGSTYQGGGELPVFIKDTDLDNYETEMVNLNTIKVNGQEYGWRSKPTKESKLESGWIKKGGSTYAEGGNTYRKEFDELFEMFPDNWKDATDIWKTYSAKKKEDFRRDLGGQDAASEGLVDYWDYFVKAKSEQDMWDNYPDNEDYAKGGKVEKKGNEMIIGGLAGILLGMFLNK
jgi:antirestriction protein